MKNKMYLIWILLAGLCGTVLRGTSLLYGYEAETGLPVKEYFPATALAVLTAVVVVAAVLLGRHNNKKRRGWSFEEMFGGMPAFFRGICMLCGLGTACICGLGVYRLPDQIVEQTTTYGDQVILPGMLIVAATMIMWVLGILSGLGMFVLAVRQRKGKQATKWTGLCATIPIFWCCLDLIMVYHENSGNPVLSDYSYMLLMIIAIMTAFYSIGSFLYSAKSAAGRWFAAAGIAVYLAFVNAGGAIMWMLRSNTDLTMAKWLGTGNALRMGTAILIGIYLLVQFANTLWKKELLKRPGQPATKE
ncbi:MAG: hypothetical protein LUE11_05750 [Clostridia bacterium]|nr:hypothetical protein [Clostridia bacterium]